MKYYVYESAEQADNKFYVLEIYQLNRRTGILYSRGQLAVGPDGTSIITVVCFMSINLIFLDPAAYIEAKASNASVHMVLRTTTNLEVWSPYLACLEKLPSNKACQDRIDPHSSLTHIKIRRLVTNSPFVL